MSVNVPSGYKQTKVGVIPEDWDVVKLGEVSKVKDGTHFSPQSTDGDFMYITSKNIKFGFLDLSNVSYISEDDHNIIFKACPVKKGQVLLTKDGANTGNACLNTIDEPFSLLSSVAYIDTHGNLNNNFLLQFFLSNTGQKKIQAEMAGQAITRLTLVKINALKIPLPPLKEQQKISQILTTWDDAITKQESLIKAKEELKKGLMQKLLSGEVRLDGFDGEWKFIRLGDLLEYEQPTPYLVANKDYDDSYKTPVLTAGKTFILGYTKEENGIFKEELPVIIFDDFTTATKYVDFPFKAKSSAMKILKAKNESVNIKLVFEMMQMINYETNDHKRYWISEYQYIELKLPSQVEQQKIALALTLSDKEIELLKNELEALKEQKRGLMQRLLSGGVRVKV